MRKSARMEWVHRAWRTARWLGMTVAGRVYLEGFVDGLHGALWRAWWRQTGLGGRAAAAYQAGYRTGVQCDREGRLPPERLN